MKPTLFVIAVTLAACGSTTTSTTPRDASLTNDSTAASDGTIIGDATPAGDGSVSGDATPAGDGSVSSDASVTPTVDAAADASVDVATPPLLGRWRVVGFEAPGMSGTLHVTDMNAPIDFGGGPIPARINGLVSITPSHVSLNMGFLTAEHMTANESDLPDAFGGPGFTISGTLTGSRFAFLGGMGQGWAFEPNIDGSVTFELDRMNHSRITLARPDAPLVTPASINVVALAQLHRPMISQPLQHPRFAILWDGPHNTWIETAGVRLAFHEGTAQFPVTIAGEPAMELRGMVGNTVVAIGYPTVYDDVDNNGHLDSGPGATDVVRGRGITALVWASVPAEPREVPQAFNETLPGWQLTRVVLDGSAGVVFLPYDPTRMPGPDLPVSEGPMPDSLPDFIP